MSDYVTSGPGEDPIIAETTFPVPPADVFAAWTDPEIVKQWFGPSPGSLHGAEIELRVGGRWRFTKSDGPDGAIGFEGRYLVIDPPNRLTFTWRQLKTRADGPPETSGDSHGELTFERRDTGTFMRVVHANIDSMPLRNGFAGGWRMGLGNLSMLLSETEGDHIGAE